MKRPQAIARYPVYGITGIRDISEGKWRNSRSGVVQTRVTPQEISSDTNQRIFALFALG